MDFKTIFLERRDNIAVLFFNRPDKFNAFTFSMMEEIVAAFDVLDSDDSFHAFIFSGKGRASAQAQICHQAKILLTHHLMILQ